MPSLKPIVFATLLACGAATAAHAQCNIYRWNVPDFDQKRDALPGDGGMYCVPTSATNWMAYISNHGYGPMMSGPRNWQDQSNYGFVTSTDSLMGVLMSTSASGGTGGNNGLNGLNVYMLSHAPFLFTASAWYGGITPFDMYFQMLTNGLVNVCYGYYDQMAGPGFNYYIRNGGHCVTLNGLVGVCGADPTLRLRNPADDSNLFTQSPFATATTRGVVESFHSSPVPGVFKTLTRMADFGVNSTTRRYLDTMYVIRSNFNCWAPATTAPEIHLSKFVNLFGDLQNQDVIFNLPGGTGFAGAIAVHPDQSKAAYAHRIIGAAGIATRLRLLNLANADDMDLGPVSPAAAGKNPITFDRFGHLITCDGSVLKMFDVSGRAPQLLFSRTLAAPASSLCFDDMLDEVVVLTPSNGRLIRCSMDLATAIDEPLPTGVPAMGDGSVIPDPTMSGRYLLTIPGDGSVRELSLITGTPRLALASSLLLPAVQSIQDIQPGDGGAFAMCDGSVRVLDRDPATGRLRLSPNQLPGNFPAMRTMSLSRSRTNFDPNLHSGPAWNNVLVDEGVTGTPDCPADFNLNGIVSVQDLFDFLAAYFANDPHADVNDSASISVQDIFDYLAAYFRGC